jgi:hypothetical protein
MPNLNFPMVFLIFTSGPISDIVAREFNENKKASQLPHQLPEIERCAGHEQIDGVTDRAFEKIPSHSMIVLEVV